MILFFSDGHGHTRLSVGWNRYDCCEGHEPNKKPSATPIYNNFIFIFHAPFWWGIIHVPQRILLSEVKNLTTMRLHWIIKHRNHTQENIFDSLSLSLLVLFFWMLCTRTEKTFMQQLRKEKSKCIGKLYSLSENHVMMMIVADECEDGSLFYVAGMLRRVSLISVESFMKMIKEVQKIEKE